jgi:hypothetical protein
MTSIASRNNFTTSSSSRSCATRSNYRFESISDTLSGRIASAGAASARRRQSHRSTTGLCSSRLRRVASSDRCRGCRGLCSGNWQSDRRTRNNRVPESPAAPMLACARPRDLANRMAHADEQLFTLPLHAARRKAREIIGQAPKDGQLAVGDSLQMVKSNLPSDILTTRDRSPSHLR